MRTVVLDDDPTGTQSATDVTVLLDWTAAELIDVLRDEDAVYLQTNSRAIPETDAVALAQRIRAEIAGAEGALGEPIQVVLRGDSTLRGHVFAETDVFVAGSAPVLFVPAFPQGGRTTVDSIHRVVIDGRDTPVGETEFARDPVFGYGSSNLVGFVEEKGGRGAIPVALDAVRSTDGGAVADALLAAGPGEFVVPDVRTDADIELIHRGLQRARERGRRVVVRCGATLAAICAGRLSRGYLAGPISVAEGTVLVVCGSHTNAATEQLEALSSGLGVMPVVVSTDAAFSDPGAAGIAAAQTALPLLEAEGVVIISSERIRRAQDDSLAHGEKVMAALMTAAASLLPSVAVVISKGGITSAEIARVAFGSRRARVRGQIIAGVSVWDHAAAGVQIIVPGNVGGRDTLTGVLSLLG